MVTWCNIAEWFDVNGEKLTLAVGGVGGGLVWQVSNGGYPSTGHGLPSCSMDCLLFGVP